jgi:hypothetical protein
MGDLRIKGAPLAYGEWRAFRYNLLLVARQRRAPQKYFRFNP